jgi:hypothetical protein
MQSIGNSEFGTSFRRLLAASGQSGERSLISEQVSVNWKIDKVALLLQLISISISNVTGALRVLKGEPCNSVKLIRPDSDDAFSQSWMQVPPCDNLVLRIYQDNEMPFLSMKDLLARLGASS